MPGECADFRLQCCLPEAGPGWALPGFQPLPPSGCVSGREGNDLDVGTVHMCGGWSSSASPSASRPRWFALQWLCGNITEQRCTGRGICRAPLQSQEVGWWRLLAPACLRAFLPVCSGPGMLQGERRGDRPPSGLPQECVMGACVRAPMGSQRIRPSCKTSPGSEGSRC